MRQQLFNGRDLTGWQMAGPGSFAVEDGALPCPWFGAWPSLVGHLTGGQEVAGSSPVAPTNIALQGPEHSGPSRILVEGRCNERHGGI